LSFRKTKTSLNRADLLRCWEGYGRESLQGTAIFFGFEQIDDEPRAIFDLDTMSPNKTIGYDDSTIERIRRFSDQLSLSQIDLQLIGTSSWERPLVKVNKKAERFEILETISWRVVAVNYFDLDKDKKKPSPKPSVSIPPLTEEDIRADFKQPPPPRSHPLAPWSKLWPFLRSVLGQFSEHGEIDNERITTEIALSLQPLERLYRFPVKTWVGIALLLLDFDQRISLFWPDFRQLVLDLEKLRGLTGLKVLLFENGPSLFCRPWGRWDALKPFRLPEAGTPILAVSDLGCFDSSGRSQKNWIRFGLRLRRAGITPTALTPAPPRLWDKELSDVWRMVAWDTNLSFPRLDYPYSAGMRPEQNLQNKNPTRLLSLLSAAVSVEPGLLRDARLLFPRQEMDVGCEAEAWLHKDVNNCPGSYALNYKFVAKYRAMFRKEPKKNQAKAMEFIRKYHARYPPMIRHEEELCLHELQDMKLPSDSLEYLARLAQSLEESNDQAIKDYVIRLSNRQHKEMWEACPKLVEIWAKARQKDLQAGGIKPPQGVDFKKVALFLNEHLDSVVYRLVFYEDEFQIISKEKEYQGWVIVEFSAQRPLLEVEIQDYETTKKEIVLLSLNETQSLKSIPVHGSLLLKTDLMEKQVQTLSKPEWADVMGRDEYGLFVEFVVKEVRQRMRWLPPGKFMMGSPVNEQGRFDDEILHEVILTEGFWLADTTCTQELWKTVMGGNPSPLPRGGRFPVEGVSWEDCREFFYKINSVVSELNLRLPTEAEWEYACRAGTTTPFSFGEVINTEEVNYGGQFVSIAEIVEKHGRYSRYRGETVQVGSLPINPWGLYEMHGNVSEWCSDWLGDYKKEIVVNPTGADEVGIRALRGGAWSALGRFVRSASRGRKALHDRFSFQGFRFARSK
jgi:formylglycine-generating enzyme required for sulfatase activity